MSHARLSPSSSPTWVTCTASVGFAESQGLTRTSSVYADEGTDAHTRAAKCLMLGYDGSLFDDALMAAHVRVYTDFVDSLQGEVAVEVEVPLFYSPEEHGTVDALVAQPEGYALAICDLKYGVGVSVEAKHNTQLAIYAESAVQARYPSLPDDAPLLLAIVQPRAREGEPIRRWELTRGELRAFCANIERAAMEIDIFPWQQLAFAPSEKACMFCPAKHVCTARAGQATAALPRSVKEEFGFDWPGVANLSPEQLAKLVHLSLDGALVSWLNGIEAWALEQMQTGKLTIEGVKLVATKPNRWWLDEYAAAKLLRGYLTKDQVYTHEIISPAQAEELLKGADLSARFKNRFEAAITRPPGKPTLALASDKRPALQPVTAATEFPPADLDLL